MARKKSPSNLPVPNAGITSMYTTSSFFLMGSETLTQVFMLAKQWLYRLSHILVLGTWFRNTVWSLLQSRGSDFQPFNLSFQIEVLAVKAATTSAALAHCLLPLQHTLSIQIEVLAICNCSPGSYHTCSIHTLLTSLQAHSVSLQTLGLV